MSSQQRKISWVVWRMMPGALVGVLLGMGGGYLAMRELVKDTLHEIEMTTVVLNANQQRLLDEMNAMRQELGDFQLPDAK